MEQTNPIDVIPGEGRHFAQGTFNNWMLPLAQAVQVAIPSAERLQVWYDDEADFYHLTFDANEKRFDIRYYKVFSVTINGKDGWIGCPRNQQAEFVAYLMQQSAS